MTYRWHTEPSGVVYVDRGLGAGEELWLFDDKAYGVKTQLARVGSYAKLFQESGAAYGVPWPWLAALCYSESGGDPTRVSSKGAKGLMQFMPAAAQEFGVGDPFDPAQAIAGAARYLGRAAAKGFDLVQCLSIYNAGGGKKFEPQPSSKSPWGIAGVASYIRDIVALSNSLHLGLATLDGSSAPPAPSPASSSSDVAGLGAVLIAALAVGFALSHKRG